jgi:hypothetical protein
LPFHEKFAIGPFNPKNSPAGQFNVFFCSYACTGGPKSKLPGAREDLNPALRVTLRTHWSNFIESLITFPIFSFVQVHPVDQKSTFAKIFSLLIMGELGSVF